MAAATAANDQDERSRVQKLEEPRGSTQEVEDSNDDRNVEDVEDEQEEGDAQDEEEEDGNEDDEDEEPRLKYVRLTGSLSSVYRNGDATSCFLVAGDKMVCFRKSSRVHPLTRMPNR